MAFRRIKVPVLRPTEENFRPFGSLLTPPSSTPSVQIPGVLDYWDESANLNLSEGLAELGYLTAHFRLFEFTQMERHVKSDEAFIPLENKACIFALAPASGPAGQPDPELVAAFILDGSVAVNLNAGVWHWAPFPMAESMNLVLALRRGTPVEDIDMFDFAEQLGIVFEIDI